MFRPVVLASASPRRQELLRQIGVEPVIMSLEVDELSINPEALTASGVSPFEIPRETSLRRSRLKMDAALEAAAALEPAAALGPTGALGSTGVAPLLLCADTVVSVNGTMLDKPADQDDARRMVRLLSGKTHSVVTAVVMADPKSGARLEAAVQTDVTFTHISPKDEDWYFQTTEWQGVAGAYRIQGTAAAFVTRIDGSYSAVMGLPIHTVYSMISRLSA
ncbi:MAG: Maf family protein [Alkalispirochaeta sp.]